MDFDTLVHFAMLGKRACRLMYALRQALLLYPHSLVLTFAMGADRRKKNAGARIEVYGHGHSASAGRQNVENISNIEYHITSSGAVKAKHSFITIPAASHPESPQLQLASDHNGPEYSWDSGELEFEFDYAPATVENLDDTAEVVTFDAPKRKRYQSDQPLRQWLPERSTYLDELLRLEDRGDNVKKPVCDCGSQLPVLYRCEDSLSLCMRCQSCIVRDHVHNPLHWIKEWNGSFFDRITLKGVGLRIQLGHELGEPCMSPKAAPRDDFVVIDCHGIHEVALDFCDCPSAASTTTQLLRARLFPATVREPRSAATFRVLEQFHLLSFESKASAYEFYHSLARRTCNTGLTPLRDRYQAFMRMVREWRHLKMLKRSARGHDPDGVQATKAGECTVVCPACPQPGRNVPVSWEDVPPDKRWLNTKFIASDANFRLCRDNVSSEDADPSLGLGWACFVEEQAYKTYLAEYAHLPQEKSTCSSHSAVNLADTKASRGLAATGVGAVDCARHNMKLPCGVGDLQKGEKYANMDYLIFSALAGFTGGTLFISYDIACQWHKHVWERMDTLPPHLHFDRSDKVVNFLVPKFHLPAHVESCQTAFSFNFIKGGGRTDGEAIERGWSNINPVSSSTKAMGPGSRRDTLDDHFGDWNWKKTVSLGTTFTLARRDNATNKLSGSMLLRKIKEAVSESQDHRAALMELEATLEQSDLARYNAEMEAWEADRSMPNPFHSRVNAPTQSSIRLMLARDEAKELENGNNVSLHSDVSPSTLITTGIDLEDQQRRLCDDLARVGPHATDIQKAKLQQRVNTLQRKLELWTTVQILYMPVVAVHQAQAASTGSEKVEPHKFKLLLPSELGRGDTCDTRLREYEWHLRHAQAHDALNQICQYLRLQSHLYHFKDRNIRGQGANTRARNVLKSVDYKVSACAKKYQCARRALQALSVMVGKVGWEIALKELTQSDLRSMTDLVDGETEGRKKLTWIWTSGKHKFSFLTLIVLFLCFISLSHQLSIQLPH
ncbi:hypothetical protein BV22DRAFT_1133151 [Leucogyrophana mollusca]|uniref:Uncharacterized protein n=1 Tax=Leucogyrophana mollusca TaxID=85980 RepID=A0ACB8B465_9AGAM|nr:hypothetical protein BV22DRAFT_1133151 [Leucogyrophana mollusca]